MFFLTVKTYRYTFLWRAAGSPEAVSNTCIFTDVAADAYYVKTVLWAYEQGITADTSATTYSPDEPCTGAQMVTFLYRHFENQNHALNAWFDQAL